MGVLLYSFLIFHVYRAHAEEPPPPAGVRTLPQATNIFQIGDASTLGGCASSTPSFSAYH